MSTFNWNIGPRYISLKMNETFNERYIIILEMALLHNLNICKRCWIRILKSGFRDMSAYSSAPTTTSTPKPVKRKLRSQTEEVMTFICVFHHCFYSTEMSCKEFGHLAIFFANDFLSSQNTLLSICYFIVHMLSNILPHGA